MAEPQRDIEKQENKDDPIQEKRVRWQA